MSVFLTDATMDAALGYIRDNGTEMYVCSGDPTTRAAAVSAALASRTGLTTGSYSGPANGDTSGRKITKSEENAIPISVTGTAAVVCICSASALIWKVDLASTLALTSGGTVDVGAFDHEIFDVA